MNSETQPGKPPLELTERDKTNRPVGKLVDLSSEMVQKAGQSGFPSSFLKIGCFTIKAVDAREIHSPDDGEEEESHEIDEVDTPAHEAEKKDAILNYATVMLEQDLFYVAIDHKNQVYLRGSTPHEVAGTDEVNRHGILRIRMVRDKTERGMKHSEEVDLEITNEATDTLMKSRSLRTGGTLHKVSRPKEPDKHIHSGSSFTAELRRHVANSSLGNEHAILKPHRNKEAALRHLTTASGHSLVCGDDTVVSGNQSMNKNTLVSSLSLASEEYHEGQTLGEQTQDLESMRAELMTAPNPREHTKKPELTPILSRPTTSPGSLASAGPGSVKSKSDGTYELPDMTIRVPKKTIICRMESMEDIDRPITAKLENFVDTHTRDDMFTGFDDMPASPVHSAASTLLPFSASDAYGDTSKLSEKEVWQILMESGGLMERCAYDAIKTVFDRVSLAETMKETDVDTKSYVNYKNDLEKLRSIERFMAGETDHITGDVQSKMDLLSQVDRSIGDKEPRRLPSPIGRRTPGVLYPNPRWKDEGVHFGDKRCLNIPEALLLFDGRKDFLAALLANVYKGYRDKWERALSKAVASVNIPAILQTCEVLTVASNAFCGTGLKVRIDHLRDLTQTLGYDVAKRSPHTKGLLADRYRAPRVTVELIGLIEVLTCHLAVRCERVHSMMSFLALTATYLGFPEEVLDDNHEPGWRTILRDFKFHSDGQKQLRISSNSFSQSRSRGNSNDGPW